MFKTHYLAGTAALAAGVIAGLVALQACAQDTAVAPPGGAPTFDAVDTNHDGTISKAEFQAFVARGPGGRGGPGGRHFMHRMMPIDIKTLDKNGDGKVSLDEFVAPMKAHFAEMDTNHDGFLQPGEMPQPRGDMPPPPPGN